MSDLSDQSDRSDRSDRSIFFGIILAAGQGQRAGGNKLMWPLGKGRVIDLVIESQSSVCHRIRVVTGAYFDELKEHISKHHPSVEVVFNENWQNGGMFSSVQLGLKDVDTEAFIQPGDIPGATPEVYRALKNSFESDKSVDFVKPTFDNKGGHPLLLGRGAVCSVNREDPGSNMRVVLGKLSGRAVPVDESLILRDIDTVEQYLELKSLILQRQQP